MNNNLSIKKKLEINRSVKELGEDQQDENLYYQAWNSKKALNLVNKIFEREGQDLHFIESEKQMNKERFLQFIKNNYILSVFELLIFEIVHFKIPEEDCLKYISERFSQLHKNKQIIENNKLKLTNN